MLSPLRISGLFGLSRRFGAGSDRAKPAPTQLCNGSLDRGIIATVRRQHAYSHQSCLNTGRHWIAEAGADVGFVEAPRSPTEIADIPRLLPWPQIINIVLGGRTPELPNEKLKELGYAGVIYANVALQSALKGMQAALGELRRKGYMGNAMELVMDFSERQRLVHKDEFDALERKYVTKD